MNEVEYVETVSVVGFLGDGRRRYQNSALSFGVMLLPLRYVSRIFGLFSSQHHSIRLLFQFIYPDVFQPDEEITDHSRRR